MKLRTKIALLVLIAVTPLQAQAPSKLTRAGDLIQAETDALVEYEDTVEDMLANANDSTRQAYMKHVDEIKRRLQIAHNAAKAALKP